MKYILILKGGFMSKCPSFFIGFMGFFLLSSPLFAMMEDDENSLEVQKITKNSPQERLINKSSTLEPQKSQKDIVFVLSIDGGGIRGLIPAKILNHIEERVGDEVKKKREQQIKESLGGSLGSQTSLPCHVHLTHCFDLMAGTSTGGIIILGLNVPDPEKKAIPLYKTSDLIKLYKERGQEIFPPKSSSFLNSLFKNKYDPAPLEELFKAYFKESNLSESVGKIIISSYELRQEQESFFESEKALSSSKKNYFMKDVARATSAAPTYFTAAKIKNKDQEEHIFVDGGLIANNPSVAAFFKAKNYYPTAKKIIVVSLGTGKTSHGGLSSKENGGLLGWGPDISGVIMDGVSEFNHHILKEHALLSPDIKYLRIQTTLNKERAQLDNVDPDNILYLISAAENSIREHASELNEFIADLASQVEFLYPDFIHKISQNLNGASLTLKKEKLQDLMIVWDLIQYLKLKKVQDNFTLNEANFSQSNLTDEGVHLIAQNLSSLAHLDVSECTLTAKGMKSIAESLKNLIDLNIAKNKFGRDGLSVLANALPSLTALNLSETDLKDEDAILISKSFQNLQRLDLSRNPIQSPGEKAILTNLNKLIDINLSYIKNNKEGFFEGFSQKTNLKSLHLSHRNLQDAEMKDFAKHLLKNKALEILNLHYNSLSAAGIRDITVLISEGGSSLISLTLSNNNIQNEGAKILAEGIQKTHSLKFLDIQKSFIGDEGILSLCQSLYQNQSLTTLNVAKNEYNEKGNTALKTLTRTRHLNIISE